MPLPWERCHREGQPWEERQRSCDAAACSEVGQLHTDSLCHRGLVPWYICEGSWQPPPLILWEALAALKDVGKFCKFPSVSQSLPEEH